MPHFSHRSSIYFPSHESTTVKKRGGDPRGQTVKSVCGRCNNEWMSKLQERAKPLLIPLVRGETITLSPEAQEIIAAWVAMFVMVAENAEPTKIAISQWHRTYFYATRTVPDHWGIWIGNYQRGHWVGHLVHNVAPITLPSNIPKPNDAGLYPPNTQTTTFVVGQLYVHAGSTSLPEAFEFVGAGTARLTRIWPVNDAVIWPPPVLSDQEADIIANAFFNRVQLAGRTLS
jgi:hypothetical protein